MLTIDKSQLIALQLMTAYQSLPGTEVDPDLAFHKATAVFSCISGKSESAVNYLTVTDSMQCSSVETQRVKRRYVPISFARSESHTSR